MAVAYFAFFQAKERMKNPYLSHEWGEICTTFTAILIILHDRVFLWEISLINGVLKGGVGVCFPDDCSGFFVKSICALIKDFSNYRVSS